MLIYFSCQSDFPCRVVEKSGRNQDGSVNGGSRNIRHFRSSSVPIPLAMENLVHSSPGPSIKTALQQVAYNNEDGGGVGGLASPRKQPPPKPKRDPNTRLSASYEAVSAGLTLGPSRESPTPEGCGSPAGSPPKTQLSPTDGTHNYDILLNYHYLSLYVPQNTAVSYG